MREEGFEPAFGGKDWRILLGGGKALISLAEEFGCRRVVEQPERIFNLPADAGRQHFGFLRACSVCKRKDNKQQPGKPGGKARLTALDGQLKVLVEAYPAAPGRNCQPTKAGK